MKYSLFHLDGPGALKHLDSLLELDSFDGIQWVYGAGDRPPCAVVNRVGRLRRRL